MKKLLSAVTSVAMSLSLMAGAFASSVSAAGSYTAVQPNVSMGEVLDVSANRTAADGKVEWLIPTVTAAPGQTVTMPVVVKSSSLAVAGAQFKIEAASPVSLSSVTDGDAYGSSVLYKNNKYAFGQGAGRGIVAADDSVVLTLAFTVPESAAAGTIYDVKWSDQFVSDTDGADITEKVTFTNGSIIIDDNKTNGNISWVLDNVTAVPGEIVKLKAYVDAPNNAALAVAGAQFHVDADLPIEYDSVTDGGAYNSAIVANDTKKSFAFGNSTGAGVVAADSSTVATFTYKVPSGTSDGTYPVKWSQGFVSDTNGKDITANVKFVDGSITVKNKPVDGKVKWVLDNVTAEKGDTVTLKATVDDSGKSALPVAGAQFKVNAETVQYAKIADGTAYGAPITANDAKQSFAFGNASGSGVAAADGSQIYSITYTIPADCPDGTYPVKWADQFVSDTDGRDITSNVIFVDGSITVGSPVDGTAEWVIPQVQAERGQLVPLNVYVNGDSDLSVAAAQFDIKGTAPTEYKTSSGTPYGVDLVKNDTKQHYSFAQPSGFGKTASDQDVIATLYYQVPADCPFDKYPVTWSQQFVSDANGGNITDKVTFVDGWIEVVDKVTTTSSVTTTTVTTTTVSSSSTTSTTVTAPQGGIIWQIGTRNAFPGETVKLPIKVVDMDNAKLPIAGAQFDITNREGINYFTIEGSDAYKADITQNPTKKKFDFATSTGAAVIAETDDNVAILTFNIPAQAAYGTYPVEFVKGSLKIFDTDGNDISDKLIGVDGAIIIVPPDIETSTTINSTTTTVDTTTTTADTTTSTGGSDVTTTGGSDVTTTAPITSTGGVTTSGNNTTTGGNVTTTSGNNTTTGGNVTTTSGNNTTTGGNVTTTSGNNTTTGGNVTTTGGNNTTTGGNVTTTGGNNTTTAGGNVTTTGGNNTTTAGGDVTTTGGNNTTTAGGDVTTTGGNGTTTAGGDVTTANTTAGTDVTITTTTIVVPRDSIAWVVDTVTARPGEEATVKITVKDPNGANLGIAGAQFKVTPDGQVQLVKTGDKSGYGADIVPSADGYKFVFADGAGVAHVAPDGTVVIELTYKVDENATPGTIIPISIKDLFVSDENGNNITKYVMPVDGAIIVVPDTTPITTTTADTTTADTTTADTTTTTVDTTTVDTTTSGDITTTTSGDITTTSGNITTTTTSGGITTTSGDITTTTSGDITTSTTDTTSTTSGDITTSTTDTTSTTSGDITTSTTDTTSTTSNDITTSTTDTTSTTSNDITTSSTDTTSTSTDTTTTSTDTTTSTSTSTVTTSTLPGYKSSYAIIQTQVGYYFSHDDGVRANGQPGGFNKGQVVALKIIDVYDDGREVERTDINLDLINFNGMTPESAYNSRTHINKQTTITDFKYDIPVYYGSMPLVDKNGNALSVTAYIGVKGDITLSNMVDASDASAALSYYAKVSTTPANLPDDYGPKNIILQDNDEGLKVSSPVEELDQLAAFLGDVNTNEWSADNWKTRKEGRVIDANDASQILSYYAKRTSHLYDNTSNSDIWNEILGDARFGG